MPDPDELTTAALWARRQANDHDPGITAELCELQAPSGMSLQRVFTVLAYAAANEVERRNTQPRTIWARGCDRAVRLEPG